MAFRWNIFNRSRKKESEKPKLQNVGFEKSIALYMQGQFEPAHLRERIAQADRRIDLRRAASKIGTLR